MKNKKILSIIFMFLFVSVAFGDPNTQISYWTTDFGSGRWQYTYDVCNKLKSTIEYVKEFTIWFDYGLYDNLTIETLDSPANNWDEIVWQPEPVLNDDGGYDALAKNLNIGIGQHVYGFAVSFDWLGTGTPSSQFYEIINPDCGYITIESGCTVPEPATLLLLGLGSLYLLHRKR